MAVLVDGNFKALPIKPELAELPHPPLWAVPVILIALFAVRGVAGFVVDYTALSWAAHRRHAAAAHPQLFARVLDATPAAVPRQHGDMQPDEHGGLRGDRRRRPARQRGAERC